MRSAGCSGSEDLQVTFSLILSLKHTHRPEDEETVDKSSNGYRFTLTFSVLLMGYLLRLLLVHCERGGRRGLWVVLHHSA
jgi:hypothetical protein